MALAHDAQPAVHTPWGAVGPLPPSPLPATCRRSGCAAPATGPDGLCAGHAERQLALRAVVDARGPETHPWGSGTSAGLAAFLAAVNLDGAPWRRDAACRGMTAAMFPETRSGWPAAAVYGPALALCAGCPVAGPCRAAGAREHHGVWGGTTPADRGYPGKRRH